ncbi:uncharacterized protein LOC118433647 [Folsomia candida]|uniref:Uncharacterized protein n=1 Tax=Folsomia candida TaxID=158441 RepID=A0A226CX38_FOLCA|nr:uncharacterized protein LOC118433647 [Folsomia candida]OXA37077.1 hypothetical protein Fcan01_28148 [Folsomia candida]
MYKTLGVLVLVAIGIAACNARANLGVSSISIFSKEIRLAANDTNGITGVDIPCSQAQNPNCVCGGAGSIVQLRITDCEGSNGCNFVPGISYTSVIDFIPSTSGTGLRLKVEVVNFGFNTVILEEVLPNSNVEAGSTYTVTYALVANDVLSGSSVVLRGKLFNNETNLLELCVGTIARIT